MIEIAIESDLQPTRRVTVSRFPCRIGRRRDNEIVLESWRVARVHAEIRPIDAGYRLVDRGTLTGTWVNGERIVEFGPLHPADEIVIAGFRLRLLGAASPTRAPASSPSQAQDAPAAMGVVPRESAPRPPIDSASPPPSRSAEGVGASALVSLPHLDERALAWRTLLHHRLLQTIDLRRLDVRQLTSEQLRTDAGALLEAILAEDPPPPGLEPARLIEDTLDEVVGLGPLERLMADPAITEIMVNGPHRLFVERGGRLQAATASFSSEAAVRAVIDRIVAPIGRRIDESSPMVDARLPDGSRVNAVIPPLAIDGSAITIRRFSSQRLRAADLVANGCADERMMRFLERCVACRRNLVIAGGTGSGKTTLLNLLAGHIGAGERLVTIEDAAELDLNHRNLVRLEARPANAEGRGLVAIRDLVRNALRMRPDRIIVGECRGGEALDMLQAMNTGHDGSLTTVHANSARDALSRLETMVLMAGMDLPLQAIREHIAAAVHIVVQQTRAADGTRRIVEITEITGTEGTRILMQPLFRHRHGRFEACGHLPRDVESLGLAPAWFLEPESPVIRRAP